MTPGSWISIDGVEGAGKTTLANAIAESKPDLVRVAEFSDGPLGRFLAEAVKKSPHHISASPGGQSLVFVGEFWERCDTNILPKVAEGLTVIQDRGYLSKFAYQYAVMEPTLGVGSAAFLEALFAYVPRPNLTVRLTAPIETIESRLTARGEGCDDQRLGFIRHADTVFRDPPIDLGDSLLFDTSRISPEGMTKEVQAYIASLVESQ